jgi:hypothetical protein
MLSSRQFYPALALNGIGPDGQEHSFLLTPVGQQLDLPPIPEPTTLTFSGWRLRRLRSVMLATGGLESSIV